MVSSITISFVNYYHDNHINRYQLFISLCSIAIICLSDNHMWYDFNHDYPLVN